MGRWVLDKAMLQLSLQEGRRGGAVMSSTSVPYDLPGPDTLLT